MSAVVARASRLLGGRGRTTEVLVKPADSSAILGALPVPVILLDPENRFRHVNHAAEQFLGMFRRRTGTIAAGRSAAAG